MACPTLPGQRVVEADLNGDVSGRLVAVYWNLPGSEHGRAWSPHLLARDPSHIFHGLTHICMAWSTSMLWPNPVLWPDLNCVSAHNPPSGGWFEGFAKSANACSLQLQYIEDGIVDDVDVNEERVVWLEDECTVHSIASEPSTVAHCARLEKGQACGPCARSKVRCDGSHRTCCHRSTAMSPQCPAAVPSSFKPKTPKSASNELEKAAVDVLCDSLMVTSTGAKDSEYDDVEPILRPSHGPGSRGSSKFLGVSFKAKNTNGQWVAQTTFGGRIAFIGAFSSEWDAGVAYAHALKVFPSLVDIAAWRCGARFEGLLPRFCQEHQQHGRPTSDLTAPSVGSEVCTPLAGCLPIAEPAFCGRSSAAAHSIMFWAAQQGWQVAAGANHPAKNSKASRPLQPRVCCNCSTTKTPLVFCCHRTRHW